MHAAVSEISCGRDVHLKIHDVAAAAGVYLHKTEKCANIFVDRVYENLIREVWPKRNLRVKCTELDYPQINIIHGLFSD